VIHHARLPTTNLRVGHEGATIENESATIENESAMNRAPMAMFNRTEATSMPYDPARHHRRSTRYPGFDYATANAYFVTICTHQRLCLLSNIMDGIVQIHSAGQVILDVWNGLPERFPGIDSDAIAVMPNHVHGILLIGTIPDIAPPPPVVGARFIAPNPDNPPGVPTNEGAMNCAPTTLGDVVRAFKAVSTRLIRTSSDPSFAWQRNYHDRIIRTDSELDHIRLYITANPGNWEHDDHNPAYMPSPASAILTSSL